MVAYLRLAHCPPTGRRWRGVINVPPRRFRAIEQALRKRPVPVTELPALAHRRGGPSARRSVEEFLAMLEDLHDYTRECTPVEALDIVLERTRYLQWLETQKDGPIKMNAVRDMRTVIAGSAAPDLGTWLVDMQLGEFDGPTAAGAKSVVLTTIHGAKGAEWPVVVLIGCEEGLLPNVRPSARDRPNRGEDEERRLAYVAFSRTQVLLYLVYCRTRRILVDGRPGRLEPRQPSRFLLGLPTNLIEHVDHGRAA